VIADSKSARAKLPDEIAGQLGSASRRAGARSELRETKCSFFAARRISCRTEQASGSALVCFKRNAGEFSRDASIPNLSVLIRRFIGESSRIEASSRIRKTDRIQSLHFG
jgi:hypothetical protein